MWTMPGADSSAGPEGPQGGGAQPAALPTRAGPAYLGAVLAGPLPAYTVLPFVAMLLAIAVCPLWIPHWWESNRNKLLVASVLGLPVVGLYAARHPRALLETAEEYVSFILLLAAST